MKSLVFSLVWLVVVVCTIVAGVGVVYSQAYGNIMQAQLFVGEPVATATEATVVGQPGDRELFTESAAGDARVVLVQNFLERYKSPVLADDPEFAQFLVDLADEYTMDFRLLPAIAMQESNLCKVIPEGTYNCLGLGIHARGTWGFTSYRENFTAAAKILKKNYIDIGLTTTEMIERKYNPTSANRDGSWASSVNQFMTEMRYDDRALGKSLKTDADLLEFTDASAAARPTPAPTKTPIASPSARTQ